MLYEYAPWVDPNAQAGQIRTPLRIDSKGSAQMQEFVHYATLAANAQNTQPWKFIVKQNTIEIHPDLSRCPSVVDP